jgi:hypothetical protein
MGARHGRERNISGLQSVWQAMTRTESGIPPFVLAYAVIVALLLLGALLG